MEILGIFLAILFFLLLAVQPLRLGRVKLDMATGPILGLLFLMLFQVIDLDIIRLGVFGNEQLHPWEIIIIFFTVAYVSISLDITGILDFLAYKIVRLASGNGLKLFLFFYLFACVLTVFTSNDIVILTLTPIIFYLGKHAKINVIPLLFAEFFGANTASMFLYIGNPTNIIIGNALGLGFWEYTQVMWFPTIVAAIANILLLFVFFRKNITKKFTLNTESTYTVRNWHDASFSSLMLVAMLVALFFSQPLGVPIWIVTSVFALIFVIEDLAFGFYYKLRSKSLQSRLQIEKQVISKLYGIPENPDEFFMAIKRVPWKILPFILVFFILIAGLGEYGLVDLLAALMSDLSNTMASSIFSHGVIGFLLANLINNQPMTILFGNILLSPSLDMSPAAFAGAAYAVIIASNLGANLTLLGALAGLMWNNILSSKGLKVSYLDFLKTGAVITPIVLLLSLASLYLVLM